MTDPTGDGIMSAISFSTKVEKETDEKGDWAVITLRGKWLVGNWNTCAIPVLEPTLITSRLPYTRF